MFDWPHLLSMHLDQHTFTMCVWLAPVFSCVLLKSWRQSQIIFGSRGSEWVHDVVCFSSSYLIYIWKKWGSIIDWIRFLFRGLKFLGCIYLLLTPSWFCSFTRELTDSFRFFYFFFCRCVFHDVHEIVCFCPI